MFSQLFGDSTATSTSLTELPTSSENQEQLSEFMRVVHIYNASTMIYSLIFFLMLGCFAASMHSQVMDNVTTNESIRKKWNANNRGDRDREQRVKACDKFHHVYFSKLPVSRIQRYHELRQ